MKMKAASWLGSLPGCVAGLRMGSSLSFSDGREMWTMLTSNLKGFVYLPKRALEAELLYCSMPGDLPLASGLWLLATVKLYHA